VSEARHQVYADHARKRAIVVERREVCRVDTITRWVLVTGIYAFRGSSGSYPVLPQVEPVDVTSATFEEWWGLAQ